MEEENGRESTSSSSAAAAGERQRISSQDEKITENSINQQQQQKQYHMNNDVSTVNSNNNNTIRHDRYNVLVEFAHKHLDFHRSELRSVLGMYDIEFVDNGKDSADGLLEWPLPDGRKGQQTLQSSIDTPEFCNKQIPSLGRQHMKHPRFPFRRPFIILSFPLPYIGTKFRLDQVEDDIVGMEALESEENIKQPQHEQQIPTLSMILSRCTLVRSVVELWGVGQTMEHCARDAECYWQHHSSTNTTNNNNNTNNTINNNNSGSEQRNSIVQRCLHPDRSWKMTIHTLGTKYTRQEQNDMRAHFSFFDFPGPVRMDHPTDEYIFIREMELDDMGSPRYPRHGLDGQLILENDALPPLAAYFGRILGGMRNWRGAGRLERYSLKKRSYLGPTSMDAELSMIMTNLARVSRGSFVFDPFVGTGSILLSCALRGAHVFGTDIDIRILRGRTDEETIYANFRQYGLPRPELVRSDNSIHHRHYGMHMFPCFHAIVCDPPYGIRAGARRSGARRNKKQPKQQQQQQQQQHQEEEEEEEEFTVRPVPEEHRHDHIAQTRPYAVSDVMSDLLDVASKTLRPNGRLVYVLPSTTTDFHPESDLPRHECLEMDSICFQPLGMELGRRIICMKRKPNVRYDIHRRLEYAEATWVHGPESANKVARIRDRLIEAAKRRPGYEEKAAARKQKRKATKEAKKKAKREAEAAAASGAAGADAVLALTK